MGDIFTVSLYGRINSGKSSIVNTLLKKDVVTISAKGGATTDSSTHEITEERLTESDLGLHIIDVPGISEVDGNAHSQDAFNSAYKSDLIVFVIESDITAIEFNALLKLYQAGKPIIVALNKTDQFSNRQLKSITSSITSKLDGYIAPENFIQIASAPVKKLMVVKKGIETFIEEPSKAVIEPLIKRVLEIASEEGAGLKKLNELLHQFKREKDEIRKRIASKRVAAEEKIFNFAAVTAGGIALNPIPWADVLGGAVSIERLVSQLEKLYELDFGGDEAIEFCKNLWSEGKASLAGSMGAVLLGSTIKSIPFIGTVTGATIQGGAVGYLVYILGMTTLEYFENDKRWKHDRSMREALDEVISHIDRKELTAKITDRIKTQISS